MCVIILSLRPCPVAPISPPPCIHHSLADFAQTGTTQYSKIIFRTAVGTLFCVALLGSLPFDPPSTGSSFSEGSYTPRLSQQQLCLAPDGELSGSRREFNSESSFPPGCV